MSVFGKNLKRLRVLAGISGKDFAQKLNISYHSYMNYENKGNEPKYAILCNIADELGVTVDELVRDHSAKNIKSKFGVLSANAEHDSLFNKLSKIMADAGYLIIKDKKGKPDPKYGERILIKSKKFFRPQTKFDYLYRMYFMIECILLQNEQAWHSLFSDQIFFYCEKDLVLLKKSSPAGFLEINSEKLFNEKIEPLTAEEIKAIVDGHAENPIRREKDK